MVPVFSPHSKSGPIGRRPCEHAPVKSLADHALDAAPDDPVGALLYAIKMTRLRLIAAGEIAAEDEALPFLVARGGNVDSSA